jgi:MFS family permease
MFAVGYSLSAWISLGVYFVSASGSGSTFPWRFPLVFQAAPAILLLIGAPWLPFSPRWLMEQGRFDEAEQVLQRLHARKGTDKHGHAETVIKEFHQIKRQIEFDGQMRQETTWISMFKSAATRKRLLVGTILMWGNMFTGVLFVANYSIILFGQLGVNGYMTFVLLGALLTMTLPGNLLTAFFVDRWGRRNFLLLGISGILVSLVCEAVMLALFLESDNLAGKRAGVFFVYLFTLFWCTCIDATQYLYLSEIFPTHLRGKGVAVGMVAYYVASVIILVAGPVALNEISWKLLLVFICPTACYLVAIYL